MTRRDRVTRVSPLLFSYLVKALAVKTRARAKGDGKVCRSPSRRGPTIPSVKQAEPTSQSATPAAAIVARGRRLVDWTWRLPASLAVMHGRRGRVTMQASRRAVLLGLSGAAAGFAGLKLLLGSPASAQTMIGGYGPLVPDPARLLDLPKGFSYRIVSRQGERRSDGLMTPPAFDAMACFPVDNSRDRVAL